MCDSFAFLVKTPPYCLRWLPIYFRHLKKPLNVTFCLLRKTRKKSSGLPQERPKLFVAVNNWPNFRHLSAIQLCSNKWKKFTKRQKNPSVQHLCLIYISSDVISSRLCWCWLITTWNMNAANMQLLCHYLICSVKLPLTRMQDERTRQKNLWCELLMHHFQVPLSLFQGFY